MMDQRLSGLLQSDARIQAMSATRFLPIMIIGGIGEWSSPHLTIAIDGQPFTALPLNLSSVDQLPADLLLAESLEAETGPTLSSSTPAAGGILNIRRKPISDSLSVTARVFAGGETGDPLVHRFTRTDMALPNKSKIDFSGGFSVANKLQQVAYRISAGTFGYFVSGSSLYTDRVISAYSSELAPKQNRHFQGMVELEHLVEGERLISFFGGLVTLRGWEMTPFTSTFGFFTGHLNTMRLTLGDVTDGLSLFTRRDGVSASMKAQYGTPSGKFEFVEYGLAPSWRISVSPSMSVLVSADVAFRRGEGTGNDSDGDVRQFFSEPVRKRSFGFGFALEHRFLPLVEYAARIRYDDHYGVRGVLSGDVRLSYELTPQQTVRLRGASVVYLPNLLETDGTFFMTRERLMPSRVDTFLITGNPNLRPERVNGIETSYSFAAPAKSLQASVGVFWNRIDNPVGQQIMRSVRTAFPGDIVRSARYGNSESRDVHGGDIELSVQPLDDLKLMAMYRFTENKHVLHAAKHVVAWSATLNFLSSSVFSVSGRFASKRIWREFAVAPTDDDAHHEGFDGSVPQGMLVNVFFEQRLKDFFFAKQVDFRIEVQNLFNKAYRNLPMGNPLDSAVLGYIAVRF